LVESTTRQQSRLSSRHGFFDNLPTAEHCSPRLRHV
jgi:hypothetical protein